MVGGLISTALSSSLENAVGTGLIASALCTAYKETIKIARLILHIEIFETLNENLDGFYDMPTYMAFDRIKKLVNFIILDKNQKEIYNFETDYNSDANINLDLESGQYTIKFLYSQYGILNGENQIVVVNGETNYTLKLYTRYFKTQTILDDAEVFTGTQKLFISDLDYTYTYVDEVGEQICLSQIEIYELKWNNWEKILNYNCTPSYFDTWRNDSYSSKIKVTNYVVGFIKDKHSRSYRSHGSTTSLYQEAYETCEKLSLWSTSNSNYRATKVQTFEDDILYSADFANYRYSFVSPEQSADGEELTLPKRSYVNRDTYNASDDFIISLKYNLLSAKSAIDCYIDELSNNNIYEINQNFFSKYGGTVIVNYSASSGTQYLMLTNFSSYKHYVLDGQSTVEKKYLPTINFFNTEFKKEREKDLQNSGAFWEKGEEKTVPYFNGATVIINTNGENKEYIGGAFTIKDFSATCINANNGFIWYSDDYAKYQ